MKVKKILLSSLATTGAIALGATTAKAATVTVKAGDTVSEIAVTHRTTVKAIQKVNHLKNVNLIYVGDKLTVNNHHPKKATVHAVVPMGATVTAPTKAQTTTTAAAPQSAATRQSSTSQASASSQTSAASQSSTSQASASSQTSAASQSSTSQASASSQTSAASQASTSTASQAKSETTTAATTTSTASTSTSEAAAKDWIAAHESGGSYTATNGRYYGKYQLTKSLLNGDLSPANQEAVANAYVLGRYGSWTAAKTFWLANGWY